MEKNTSTAALVNFSCFDPSSSRMHCLIAHVRVRVLNMGRGGFGLLLEALFGFRAGAPERAALTEVPAFFGEVLCGDKVFAGFVTDWVGAALFATSAIFLFSGLFSRQKRAFKTLLLLKT
jgi:hypothetical protein